MEAIFLNIWGGKLFDPLAKFIKESAMAADFFCFQELTDGGILNEIKLIIPDYNCYYSEELGIFSKKNIKISSEDKIKNLQLQYIRFVNNGKNITLCNFHGIALPGDKLDTENRIKQSIKIIDFLGKENAEKILGGDFNLMPQTKSIKMIEICGMRNLIKDFNISSTRSDINYEIYKSQGEVQRFADFVFASPGINVKNFRVPRLNISDHLPLILDFD